MRRFEKHQCSRIGRDFFESRASFTRARGQKAFETESICRQARNRERCSNCRRTRHDTNVATGTRGLANELVSRIGQQRRARVAHQRYGRARFEPRRQLRHAA